MGNRSLRRTQSGLVALLWLAAAGCPPGAEEEVPLGAWIVVEAVDSPELRRLDLGEVELGQQAVGQVEVRNIGDATLALEELRLDAPFDLQLDDDYSPLVPVGGSTRVGVRYAPLHDESARGDLVFLSNASNLPQVPVRLFAEGLGPRVELWPPFLDFELTPVGCVETGWVSVLNAGRRPASLLDVRLDALDGGEELSLWPTASVDGDPATVDLVLEPGNAHTAVVDHAPVDDHPDRGLLCVRTDTPGEALGGACVDVLGVGVEAARVNDTWLIPDVPGVDVLVVVDTGSQMLTELEQLPSNAELFAEGLMASELDFHLAVIPTDVNTVGQFVGAVPIVTRSTPDPVGTFVASASFETTGGINQGLHNTLQALENAANNTGNNAGFLRDDASLRLLFVWDRSDASGAVMGWTWELYLEGYRELALGAGQLVISSVIGGLAGCSGPGGDATATADAFAITEATGGQVVSICDGHWADQLHPSWLDPGPMDTFPLTWEPLTSTIEVRVDGELTAEGWSWVPELEAVRFDDEALPPGGSEVVVSYAVAPDCTPLW